MPDLAAHEGGFEAAGSLHAGLSRGNVVYEHLLLRVGGLVRVHETLAEVVKFHQVLARSGKWMAPRPCLIAFRRDFILSS